MIGQPAGVAGRGRVGLLVEVVHEDGAVPYPAGLVSKEEGGAVTVGKGLSGGHDDNDMRWRTDAGLDLNKNRWDALAIKESGVWRTVGMERSFFWVLVLLGVPAHAFNLGGVPETTTCCGRCYTAMINDFASQYGRAYQQWNAFDYKAVTDKCNFVYTLDCAKSSVPCSTGYENMDCLNLRWSSTTRCRPIQSECYLAVREDYKTLFGYYPSTASRSALSDEAVLISACAACYSTTDRCTVGKEKKECKNLRWYSLDYCQPCPSGSYRNNIATQPNCVACQACHPTEGESSPCTTISDRQCSCQTTGTYKAYQIDFGLSTDPSRTFCPTCTTCAAPTQRMVTDCEFAKDRVCAACDEGSRSTFNNNLCDACKDGHFAVNGVCRPCTASNAGCIRDQYINCVGGTRTCPVCDGHVGGTQCAAGRGVAGRCDGSSLRNPPCQDCGPGLERPEGTPLTSAVYQACVQCGVGKYKAAAGTGNCVDCTNKPANSVYRAWNAISEVASTSNCPW